MGGAERVAANISLYAPKNEFEFHYLVFEGYDNVYGPEIEKIGGRIITVPPPSSGYSAYIKTLSRLIRENHYCAVHSHTMFNSGINLLVAKACGVPVRIGHSHTTKTETRVSIAQKSYEWIMRKMILWSATDLFACGVEAGKWMFGIRAFYSRGHIIHNGIDTDAFAFSDEKRRRIRAQYGFTTDDLVIGHSGTLIPLKNQEYLIRLLPDLLRQNPHVRLMLLGAGDESEKSRLAQLSADLHVSERVTFCGGVMNANDHLNAMDVFAFPSLREGTPLALIEAQANGLPCVISDHIPDDAALTDLITVVSLAKKDVWTHSLLEAKRSRSEQYAEVIASAGYSITSSFDQLYKRYRQEPLRSLPTVSLSFDDARGDNAVVLGTIMARFGFPGTLNVTTGYVDGTCPREYSPSTKAAMTREEVIRLRESGKIEIAMHGDRHLNTLSDAEACRKKLSSWFGVSDQTVFGFASPGSGMSLEAFRSSDYRSFRSSILYMRTGLRICSRKNLRVFCRKMGRVVHIPLLYEISFADTIMRFRDGKIVYSIPVMKDATLAQIKAVLRRCIGQGGHLILMFHSILPETSKEDNWTWSQEKFERLCTWLQKKRDSGELELLTTAQQFSKMEY